MSQPPDREHPALDTDLTRTVDGPSVAAHTLGPYRLLHRLGEGGMGEVWLAEQTQPIRRRVAIKVIKAGMDTRQVVRRFEAERQALALMEHPAVAKVFDAGSTPEGRPYFVMEYVPGEPITTYCDRERLTTAARISLFIRVCEGVQHAHQKGIIHRDLKPSNILVALQDDRPVPKIIDFGVAKATAQQLTGRTLVTEFGALVGTPEYMSPEQAEMTGLDIDTRTDVYALGMIFYELLTGGLPFDAKALRERGLDEIRRTIRDVDPPRPSTQVTSLGPAAVDVAHQRGTDPARLAGQLRRDLDWITMKALEKDRTRRYGAASDLAADLRRYLDNEPVLASPPSTRYRVGKFVRRHRLGVAATTTLIVLLIAFAATMAIQARRIARERDRANRETEAAKQVSDFLTGLFSVSDPSEARGNTITAREILDKGATTIDKELAAQPEMQARLMNTMGGVYRNLGLYDQAASLLERALQTRRRVLGRESPDTLASISSMGALQYSQGKFPEAEASFREVLEGRRLILGVNHPDTLSAMRNLGGILVMEGKDSDGEPYLREAVEISRRLFGSDAPETLASMTNLGALLQLQGKYSEAERSYREALAGSRRVRGNDHPSTLLILYNVGAVLEDENKLDEAETLLREALDGRRRVLGPDHPDALRTASTLGHVLGRKGNATEAEQYLRDAQERQRRALTPRHPDTATTLVRLGEVLNDQKRYADAESILREGLQIHQAAGDRRIAWTMSVLGESLLGQKKFTEAEPLLVEGYAGVARRTEFTRSQKRNALGRIVKLYDSWGRPEQAAEWRAKLSEAGR